MAHPFFAFISRMRYITRWGLMRNSFSENIQEHSHMVAVFAHALAVIGRDVYGKEIDPGKVATIALYHDASEIFTGDLPTPVKYKNPEIQAAYKKVEEHANENLLAMLPHEMQTSYIPLLTQVDHDCEVYVKGADKLSAYIKCVEELKAGNEEFRTAAEECRRALDDMKLAELEYFTKHFLPAFSLTLDELQEKEGF